MIGIGIVIALTINFFISFITFSLIIACTADAEPKSKLDFWRAFIVSSIPGFNLLVFLIIFCVMLFPENKISAF